jgi:hypothetical protein
MRGFTFALLFASVALGQDVTLTFQLKNTSGQGLQEILTTLHTVVDVMKLSADTSVSTVTVTGTPGQIALSEWLIPKLDALSGTLPTPQKYLVGGNNNDIVEVFELKNSPSIYDLQEILTGLRTVAQIAKIYQVAAPRLMIMRADANHIAVADFLIPQLDQPAAMRTAPSIQSLQTPDGSGDTVIVYGLANTKTNLELQEILTNLRTVLNIQCLYQRTGPKLLSFRGNAVQVQTAEWLIPQLDKQTATGSGSEMRVPNGKDDVLHVFYLAEGANTGDALKSVRQMKVPMVYVSTRLPALTVRATADQIAMVGATLPLR